eukprot:CAMPEP_0115476576 /NCGR_PEP_ID=MMETSP0271-20121206/55210_1 /TAXON_ID=71861 /ORGANISM="Scrippsiella trochoidea, Strain CCMP3099" /LENGTH=155 /DNA_ID=CAMNT_0002903997 /DNA_START=222 /DNA_END=689 /DNA_ORIENTATION=-
MLRVTRASANKARWPFTPNPALSASAMDCSSSCRSRLQIAHRSRATTRALRREGPSSLSRASSSSSMIARAPSISLASSKAASARPMARRRAASSLLSVASKSACRAWRLFSALAAAAAAASVAIHAAMSSSCVSKSFAPSVPAHILGCHALLSS